MEALQSTRTVASEALRDFQKFIETGSDDELFRMCPLRYGRANGLDDATAIDLFLHATRAGVLEFSWGLTCPGCGAFLSTSAALHEIMDTHHCALCVRTFDTVVDQDVEVTFTVSPAVRPIRFHDPQSLDLLEDLIQLYFSPSVEDKDRYQAWLDGMRWWKHVPPEASEEVLIEADPGSEWGVLATEHHVATRARVEDGGADEVTIDFFEGQLVAHPAVWAPGKVRVKVTNRSPDTVGLVLGRKPDHEPTDRARRGYFLGGRRLLTSQTFRDLFRTASLPGDRGLALRSLTILFTDLRGSTALYERVGDMAAFSLVREHFRVLEEIVIAHRGAVVKTIGDAVMATFDNSGEAVCAAREMHRRVAAAELSLKVGIHTGPCIAVDLNRQLDYFGHTVNLAARIQSAASGGETLITDAVAAEAEKHLSEHDPQLFKTHVELRGVTDPVSVCRVRWD